MQESIYLKEVKRMEMYIPENAAIIIERLMAHGFEAYAVGGCVRDSILGREPEDWDITTSARPEQVKQIFSRTVDTGIEHGTVTVLVNKEPFEVTTYRIDGEYEDARHPKNVQFTASLLEDLKRRDFTINALAISLNQENYGTLVDPFEGLQDLENGILKTPLDPIITFSDDPLRMMRAVRFASQLNFTIEPVTFESIIANRDRLKIVSKERIMDEFNKIMVSPKPSVGLKLLEQSGLLSVFFPELSALKGVEHVDGIGHKDNFYHTLTVVDSVSRVSNNLWLRWAALLHDIAKPVTKKFIPGQGWTFYGHNHVGERMVGRLFNRLKLPQNEKMKYVQKLVGLHMRPIVLSEDIVTDSAVRRLLFDAGDDIDDLMTLAEADITSKNMERKQRFLNSFQLVRQKLKDLEEKDRIRNFQPPVSGEEIMETFGLQPCREVGTLKSAIKDAILDGVIPNEYEAARTFMLARAKKMGLTPVIG